MKKVFKFEMSIMNGMVTMGHYVSLYGSRKLAEETRKAVICWNATHSDDMGLRPVYGEVEEIEIYESKDEIPFFQKHGED